ncbi:MAG: hypothetical protein V2A76_03025 [Planctomycetota bacterium]
MKTTRMVLVLVTAALAVAPAALSFDGNDDSKRMRQKKQSAEQVQEEINRAFEAWGERYGTQWENWAKQSESRWEKFGEAYGKEWEQWGENYGKAWEEWAKQVEKGGELDLDEMMALGLKGLEGMPLDSIHEKIIEEVSSMQEIDWGGLDELSQLIQMTIEHSLEGVEGEQLKGQLREALEQALSDVQNASVSVRSAVESSRGRIDRRTNRSWRLLEKVLEGKKLEEAREEGEEEPLADEELEQIRERAEELERRDNTKQTQELIQQLRSERSAIRERDREVRSLKKEIELLRQEVEELKKQQGVKGKSRVL